MLSSIWQGSVRVLVSLQGPTFPPDSEWDRHLDLARQMRQCIGDGALFRVLVLSDGGGPTSSQRAKLHERAGRQAARGAVVTMSRLAAGIGTVMSLRYPGVKIFTPHDFHRVLAHLEIPGAELPALVDHIRAADEALRLECVAEMLLTLGPAP